jgi:drug/metabolite transporter (DMT)-like permease
VSAAAPAQPAFRWGLASLAGFALMALIWGSTWLVIKDQIATLPPTWTVTWRFVLAALGMAVLAWARGESLWIGRGGLMLAALLGLTQFCGNFQMVYRAEHYVTSGLVAVIYALLMVPNAVLARVFLGTRVSGRFVAGSALALAGIAMLMAHEFAVAGAGAHVGLGVGFALAGTLCASAANVMQAGTRARAYAVVPLVGWAMLFGAMMDAALALLLDGPPSLPASPRYWGGVAYLALIGSVVAFPLYFTLIRQMGAGRAAYVNAVVPVVAMALSTLFEGYVWGALAIVGSVVAMAGLVWALSGRR